jgi:Protein of unknown function (DUF2934)
VELEEPKLKSKEPKEPKEKKKSESKPRKSAAKRQMARPAASPELYESTNGTATPVAMIETVTVVVEPPEETIRVRAYEIFVERGYEHGHHVDDWLAAEQELKSRNRAT